jgi:hypothetical protein
MPGSSENKPIDDDEAWLEVLAGRSVDTMDEASRQQAARVRAALMRRKVRVASTAPPLGDAAFERLLFRMKREGVDSGRASTAGRPPLFRWGIAASVIFAVMLVFETQHLYVNGEQKDDSHTLMRGENEFITLDVKDPVAIKERILSALSKTDAAPEFSMRKDGAIVVKIKATQSAVDALSEINIYPNLNDGYYIIVLKKIS